jgi:hypothetical protein
VCKHILSSPFFLFVEPWATPAAVAAATAQDEAEAKAKVSSPTSVSLPPATDSKSIELPKDEIADAEPADSDDPLELPNVRSRHPFSSLFLRELSECVLRLCVVGITDCDRNLDV